MKEICDIILAIPVILLTLISLVGSFLLFLDIIEKINFKDILENILTTCLVVLILPFVIINLIWPKNENNPKT